MAERSIINTDLADVWAKPGRDGLIRTLAWGDEVSVRQKGDNYVEVALTRYRETSEGSILPEETTGFIEPTKASKVRVADLVRPRDESTVLKVNFVDVQQGDGSVIETPSGKVILVDGGDNQLFARYLAGRFRGTSLENPLPVECIIVTHGDADHFGGLTEIFVSEQNERPLKRIFVQPRRVYHNGIVKRPSGRPESELLGPTKKVGDGLFLVGLVENLLKVPDKEMNKFFKAWKRALKNYNDRSEVSFRRLEIGDDDAFDFLRDENINIQVLGPLTDKVAGQPALKFLGDPPKGPRIGHESLGLETEGFKGLSASHTINGHSIVFRMSYGGFSFLFSGDLNDEASRNLVQQHKEGSIDLRADVFKVPHHGSADFSGAFVQAVEPIVSIVSSGDESARKEYIHPRATLMGALGKWSRVDEPLILVTELVAFFNLEGWARLTDKKRTQKRGDFFAFSRTAFGIVKTRTDGRRLLVYTDSGNVAMKEAYAYALDETGVPQPTRVVRA